MSYDAHANFAYSTVVVAPVPALAGLSLTVAAGQGALFPAVPFNATVWPSGTTPISTNAEIIRVTGIVGDTLTILRAQEGSSARAIQVGDQIANTITAKVFQDIETQALTAVNFSAGTTSNNLSDVVFSNSNGVSFGLNGSTITAQHNGLTSQSNQAFSAQGGSSVFQTLSFNNANGVTFSNNAGAVEASYTVPSTAGLISAVNVSAGTTSNNLSALTFSNGNGVSFGLNASVVTASVGAGAAPGSLSAGTTSVALGQVIFSNSNSISFGLDGATVTASISFPAAAGGMAISAGTQSNSTGTVVFSNSNGISFGMSNSSIVTAIYTVPTLTNSSLTISNGATSATVAQLAFTNANGISFSLSTGAGGSHTIVGSHNGLTTQTNQQMTMFATGNTTQSTSGTSNASSLIFQGAGNVSVGISAGSVVISGGTNAAGAVADFWAPPWAFSAQSTNSTLANRGIYFMPICLNQSVSGSRINFYVSVSCALSNGNSTGAGQMGAAYGIYTRNMTGTNSQTLSLLTSYSMTVLSHTMNSNTQYVATHFIGLSNATSHSTTTTAFSTSNATTYALSSLNGPRVIQMPLGLTLTPGCYWVGFQTSSTSSGGAITNAMSVQMANVAQVPAVYPFGVVSSASNASVFRALQAWGSYSATTAAWPNSIAFTTDDIRAAVNQTLVNFNIAGFATSTNLL